MYVKIVKETFDHDLIRALKSYMDDLENEHPMTPFSDWISMKPFTYRKEKYYEVKYPTSTVLFHILTMEDYVELLYSTTDPKVVKNMLWKLPVECLGQFLDCNIKTLAKMKNAITNIEEYNEMVSWMLHFKGYEELVSHLEVERDLEEDVHEYFFKELARDRIGHKMYAGDEQRSNCWYMTHKNEEYIIMWYEY